MANFTVSHQIQMGLSSYEGKNDTTRPILEVWEQILRILHCIPVYCSPDVIVISALNEFKAFPVGQPLAVHIAAALFLVPMCDPNNRLLRCLVFGQFRTLVMTAGYCIGLLLYEQFVWMNTARQCCRFSRNIA